MNPNLDTPPSLHLPEPAGSGNGSAPERAPGSNSPEFAPVAAPESAPAQSATPSFALPAQDDTATAAQVATASPIGPTPAVADDNDLIEQEWVLKAKQIVNSTHDDPYQQNRQLAAMKADYMQKRYQKTVKVED